MIFVWNVPEHSTLQNFSLTVKQFKQFFIRTKKKCFLHFAKETEIENNGVETSKIIWIQKSIKSQSISYTEIELPLKEHIYALLFSHCT